MIKFILAVAFVLCLVRFPAFRCAVSHPFFTLRHAITDGIRDIKQRAWNRTSTGRIVCYCGLFGRGKTLSVVHDVVGTYRRKNGRMVWCAERMRLVRQRVHIISNVELKGVPYEKLVSLEQLIKAADDMAGYDRENGCLTVTLVVIDEASVQLNSRAFKTNIDPLVLNTILTCRHYHMSIYLTAQRFSHLDALMRQVTSHVVECDKVWRFQTLRYYDARELEFAPNPDMVKPIRPTRCFAVRDRDYAAYDTLACVGNLKKAVDANHMMTEAEILELQCNQTPDMGAVVSPSARWVRAQKKFWKRGK